MRSLTAPEERRGKKEEKCLKGGIWFRSADIFTPLYEGSKAAQPPSRLIRSFRFLPVDLLFSLVSSWVNDCVRWICWLMSSDGFTLTNPTPIHKRINQGLVYFCGTGSLAPCPLSNSHHHEVPVCVQRFICVVIVAQLSLSSVLHPRMQSEQTETALKELTPNMKQSKFSL